MRSTMELCHLSVRYSSGLGVPSIACPSFILAFDPALKYSSVSHKVPVLSVNSLPPQLMYTGRNKSGTEGLAVGDKPFVGELEGV